MDVWTIGTSIFLVVGLVLCMIGLFRSSGESNKLMGIGTGIVVAAVVVLSGIVEKPFGVALFAWGAMMSTVSAFSLRRTQRNGGHAFSANR